MTQKQRTCSRGPVSVRSEEATHSTWPSHGATARADGYFFTRRVGGPLALRVLRRVAMARAEVGLPGIPFHGLRHRAASTKAGAEKVLYRLVYNTHQAAVRYQHATRQCGRAIADALGSVVSK